MSVSDIVTFRWLKIGARERAEQLANKLRVVSLLDGAEFSSTEGAMNRFRFVRSVGVTTRRIVNGEVVEDVIPSVQVYEFQIFTDDGNAYIRLEGELLDLITFAFALERCLGERLMCQPVTFGSKLQAILMKQMDSVELRAVTVSNAALAPGIVGTLELRSDSDIQSKTLAPVCGKGGIASRSTYQLLYRGVRGEASFAQSGIARVSNLLAARVIHTIEADLSSIAAA
jgi:hypothetical protein